MKKLELKKKIIVPLNDAEQRNIMGGDDEAYTTSFTACTHFICCGDTCSVTPTNCGDTCGNTGCGNTCDATCGATCMPGCPTNTCNTCGCPQTQQTNCNQLTCRYPC